MDILVNTINLAAIYALVALGISLVWASLGFLNLAHGAGFAAAGYTAWWATEHIGTSAFIALLGGIVGGVAGGLVIYVVAYRPLADRANWPIRSLMATLALYYVGVNGLQEIFGPSPKRLPEVFGSGHVTVLGSVVTWNVVGTVLSAAVLLALVVAGLRTSRVGLSVRALTQNPEGAALVGINRTTAAAAVLAVSGAMVGVASVLLGQVFFVSPESGLTPMIKGLIVAMLGGLGSVPGTIVAAVLVGAVEALTSEYLGGEYVLITLFALIGIVLGVRPRGVSGLLESQRA